MTRSRQAVLALAAAFALVAVYHDPQGTGGAVRDALSVVAGLVTSIFEFAGALAG